MKKIVVPTVIFPPGSAKVPGFSSPPLSVPGAISISQQVLSNTQSPRELREPTQKKERVPTFIVVAQKFIGEWKVEYETQERPAVGLTKAVFPKTNRVNAEIVVKIIANRRRRFMLTILRSPERPYGLSVAVLAIIYPVNQGIKHKPVTEQANRK